jgi:hypothetical protein
MTAPQRIQLRRAKGWRMPENTVKVDRSTKWGNPFIVGQDGTRAECVELYKALLAGLLCITCKTSVDLQKERRAYVIRHIAQLRGHNLACWCPPDQPCHADVLLELANAPIADNTEAS